MVRRLFGAAVITAVCLGVATHMSSRAEQFGAIELVSQGRQQLSMEKAFPVVGGKKNQAEFDDFMKNYRSSHPDTTAEEVTMPEPQICTPAAWITSCSAWLLTRRMLRKPLSCHPPLSSHAHWLPPPLRLPSHP